jgi:malonyl-CoA decarboxylase
MAPGFFKRFLEPSAASAAARDARRAVDLCHALVSERGEVSGAHLAADVVAAYQSLSTPASGVFFDLIAEELSPPPGAVSLAADAYAAAPTPANLVKLQRSVEAPRQELFRRLVMADGGIRTLVDLRRKLLETLDAHPHRVALEADLLHLFRSWFSRGFLVLQRIDWHTSAVILERLIEYEAVHQIQGWRDLRRRLQADRRCYAFFHPAWPDEPLIFIEVALAQGMSAQVQPLLDPDSHVADPSTADSAIFYSITACQEGLRGVSFGSFLIKQVAEDLGRTFPRLRTFATLSPIPGFRKWLEGETAAGADVVPRDVAGLVRADDEGLAPAALAAPSLRRELFRLCARYLLHAKRAGAPLDSVARFHLANGARMERLNWLADTSAAGMYRSLGMMVNYLYRLNDIERNHEAYAKEMRVVASRELMRLAAPVRRPRHV